MINSEQRFTLTIILYGGRDDQCHWHNVYFNKRMIFLFNWTKFNNGLMQIYSTPVAFQFCYSTRQFVIANNWNGNRILTLDVEPLICARNEYVELNGCENHCDTSSVSIAWARWLFKRMEKFGSWFRNPFKGFACKGMKRNSKLKNYWNFESLNDWR